MAPSLKDTSRLLELSEATNLSPWTNADKHTALNTNTLHGRPKVELMEDQSTFVPWKIPAAHSDSLADVTISEFVADFVKLNGEQRASTVTEYELVRSFNHHIDMYFPGSANEAKISALRRKKHKIRRPLSSQNFQPSRTTGLFCKEN